MKSLVAGTDAGTEDEDVILDQVYLGFFYWLQDIVSDIVLVSNDKYDSVQIFDCKGFATGLRTSWVRMLIDWTKKGRISLISIEHRLGRLSSL